LLGALERRYAVERLLAFAVQSVVDCSRLLVSLEDWRQARDERDALFLLAERQVIDADLAGRLTRAKGFRNVLVHEYVEVDPDFGSSAPSVGPRRSMGLCTSARRLGETTLIETAASQVRSRLARGD
jgi:hypothetical protein